MAENFGPFAAGAGSNFNTNFWEDLFGNLFSSGVIKGGLIGGAVTNDLAVTPPGSGMTINIGTGVAFNSGFFYENTTSLSKTIAAADASLDRIDYITIRLTTATPNVVANVITGALSSSPVAPSLTQTGTTWDIPIARVSVPHGTSSITSGLITDARVYCAVSTPLETMGAGSGVNADLLDGLDSSAFVLTAGQVARILAVTGAQPTNSTGNNNDLILWYRYLNPFGTNEYLPEPYLWSRNPLRSVLPTYGQTTQTGFLTTDLDGRL